ncbi:MAG TPA: MFS transporter, partial [Rubrivivax sp.]|nr:MFS transporter [Rubrivivax sp.]
VGGQLISASAAAMAFGAPLLAALLGGWDRRRLLTLALLWFGLGHLLAAAMPGFGALLPVRALSVLGAAVFTPQAAAAIGRMTVPAERGRAITFIFLGWSVSSVIGMPLHSFVGESFGWRWAFALVALFSLAAAAAVWRTMPDGVRPPPLSLAQWRTVFTHPVLMAIVAITALSGSGQFTLFSYFAPYYRQQMQASPAEVSLLFMWFGAFGLLGNLLVTRWVDRIGAGRAVSLTLGCMALSMLAWPLAGSTAAMALVLVPWALGCFSSNSAQQARASDASAVLAPALLALNTSAIYLGQAVGAAGGGALLAASGWRWLHWVGLAWLLAAIALSVWVERRA